MTNERPPENCLDARSEDIEAEVERMLAMEREIRARMTEPVTSDLRDLYDDDGCPIDGGDVVRSGIEPALKE
jgi:hypothetical protein